MSCDLLPTESPGAHYQGDVRHVLDGFMPVQFQADCDPDGDGWCQVRDCDPATCDCVGPTQDDIEYVERDGILFGRPEANPHWDLMIAHPPCTFLTGAAEWAYKDVQTKKLSPDKLYGAARRAAREEALEFIELLWNAPIEKICIENPVGVINTRLPFMPKPQIIQPWYFGDDASKKTCLWLKNLPELYDTNRLPGDAKTRRANQTASGQNKLPPSADRWKLRSYTYQGIADAMATQWGVL
jgi:hypothetical protein